MHDGSFWTLDEVLDHYASGGKNPLNQHYVIKPFNLSETEKKQLISFLKSLTDTSYLVDFRDF